MYVIIYSELNLHMTHTAFVFKSNDGIKILDNKCMKDGNGACKDLKHAKILVWF